MCYHSACQDYNLHMPYPNLTVSLVHTGVISVSLLLVFTSLNMKGESESLLLKAICQFLLMWITRLSCLFTVICIFHVTPNSYGLLGPSGCGKTTLLKCIVGTLKISRGHITVLGKPPAFPGHQVPGRMVGYMPQVSPADSEAGIRRLTF